MHRQGVSKKIGGEPKRGKKEKKTELETEMANGGGGVKRKTESGETGSCRDQR